MRRIAGVLGQKIAALAPYLSTLVALGFIGKSRKNPEKDGILSLSISSVSGSGMCILYKGELDNMQIVLGEISKDFIEKFVAFEGICRGI